MQNPSIPHHHTHLHLPYLLFQPQKVRNLPPCLRGMSAQVLDANHPPHFRGPCLPYISSLSFSASSQSHLVFQLPPCCSHLPTINLLKREVCIHFLHFLHGYSLFNSLESGIHFHWNDSQLYENSSGCEIKNYYFHDWLIDNSWHW